MSRSSEPDWKLLRKERIGTKFKAADMKCVQSSQLVKATCWLLDTWVEKKSQQVSLRSSTSLKHKTVATFITQGKRRL